MIEDLESNLTAKPIDALNYEDSAVAEEANAYESIITVANDSNETKLI